MSNDYNKDQWMIAANGGVSDPLQTPVDKFPEFLDSVADDGTDCDTCELLTKCAKKRNRALCPIYKEVSKRGRATKSGTEDFDETNNAGDSSRKVGEESTRVISKLDLEEFLVREAILQKNADKNVSFSYSQDEEKGTWKATKNVSKTEEFKSAEEALGWIQQELLEEQEESEGEVPLEGADETEEEKAETGEEIEQTSELKQDDDSRERLLFDRSPIIDEASNVLQAMMNKIAGVFVPDQVVITSIRAEEVNEGKVIRGSVEAKLNLSVPSQKRRGSVCIEIPIRQGLIEAPRHARLANNREVFEWSEDGLRKAMQLKIEQVKEAAVRDSYKEHTYQSFKDIIFRYFKERPEEEISRNDIDRYIAWAIGIPGGSEGRLSDEEKVNTDTALIALVQEGIIKQHFDESTGSSSYMYL